MARHRKLVRDGIVLYGQVRTHRQRCLRTAAPTISEEARSHRALRLCLCLAHARPRFHGSLHRRPGVAIAALFSKNNAQPVLKGGGIGNINRS